MCRCFPKFHICKFFPKFSPCTPFYPSLPTIQDVGLRFWWWSATHFAPFLCISLIITDVIVEKIFYSRCHTLTNRLSKVIRDILFGNMSFDKLALCTIKTCPQQVVSTHCWLPIFSVCRQLWQISHSFITGIQDAVDHHFVLNFFRYGSMRVAMSWWQSAKDVVISSIHCPPNWRTPILSHDFPLPPLPWPPNSLPCSCLGVCTAYFFGKVGR